MSVWLTSQYCFFYLLIYCTLNSYLFDIKSFFAQTWQVSGNSGNSSFDGNVFIDFRKFCFYTIKFYFVGLINNYILESSYVLPLFLLNLIGVKRKTI